MRSKQVPGWAVVAFLAFVAASSHLLLVPVGFEFLNGDYAPVNVTANEFIHGKWNIFYFGLPYGGVTLTVLRALWVALWGVISGAPDANLTGHLVFSFVVCPVLMTLAAYTVVSAYCSRFAAFFVGLTAAIGFQFWVAQYGNDTYVAYQVLGCLLLAWRARYRNPLMEMRPRELFMAAALGGLATYTSRASLSYVVAFFLPWEWFWGELKRLFTQRGSLERTLVYVSVGLLALFFYLEIFGPDMGVIFGKRLRVHAQPNFKYAVLILLALEIKLRWKQIRGLQVRRALIAVAGFLVGMSPELVHFMRLGELPPRGMGGTMKFSDMMGTIGTLPSSFQEIFAAGDGIGRNASIALLVLGVYFLIRRVRREAKLQPVALVGALTVFAYCRYHSYTFASPRYLFPMMPAAFVAMGCMWDEVSKRSRGVGVAAIALLAFHGIHQLNARMRMADEVHAGSRLKEAREIIAKFREAGVKFVITDDYWWHGSNLSVLSQLDPVFHPPETPGLRWQEGEKQVHLITEGGVLMKSESAHPAEITRTLYGRKWNLKPLAVVGGETLYTAKVTP